jgi:hypothetical protein
MIVFDIETGPLPSDEIRANSAPFVPAPPPGDFDPSAVKLGNLKDEAKIAAKINDAREEYLRNDVAIARAVVERMEIL